MIERILIALSTFNVHFLGSTYFEKHIFNVVGLVDICLSENHENGLKDLYDCFFIKFWGLLSPPPFMSFPPLRLWASVWQRRRKKFYNLN
jgi:hypothetical protein